MGESRFHRFCHEGRAHTCLGGLSPSDKDLVLKTVSIHVPGASTGHIRLAVYAGGTLEDGPHAGTPAKLSDTNIFRIRESKGD